MGAVGLLNLVSLRADARHYLIDRNRFIVAMSISMATSRELDRFRK